MSNFGGGHAVYFFPNGTLVLLRSFEAGGQKLEIALTRAPAGLSCRICAPYVHEKGGDVEMTGAFGGQMEHWTQRLTSSSCRISALNDENGRGDRAHANARRMAISCGAARLRPVPAPRPVSQGHADCAIKVFVPRISESVVTLGVTSTACVEGGRWNHPRSQARANQGRGARDSRLRVHGDGSFGATTIARRLRRMFRY
jgi:hypothetical protein